MASHPPFNLLTFWVKGIDRDVFCSSPVSVITDTLEMILKIQERVDVEIKRYN